MLILYPAFLILAWISSSAAGRGWLSESAFRAAPVHAVVEPTQAGKDKHAHYKCCYPERNLAAPETKTDHSYKP